MIYSRINLKLGTLVSRLFLNSSLEILYCIHHSVYSQRTPGIDDEGLRNANAHVVCVPLLVSNRDRNLHKWRNFNINTLSIFWYKDMIYARYSVLPLCGILQGDTELYHNEIINELLHFHV